MDISKNEKEKRNNKDHLNKILCAMKLRKKERRMKDFVKILHTMH